MDHRKLVYVEDYPPILRDGIAYFRDHLPALELLAFDDFPPAEQAVRHSIDTISAVITDLAVFGRDGADFAGTLRDLGYYEPLFYGSASETKPRDTLLFDGGVSKAQHTGSDYFRALCQLVRENSEHTPHALANRIGRRIEKHRDALGHSSEVVSHHLAIAWDVSYRQARAFIGRLERGMNLFQLHLGSSVPFYDLRCQHIMDYAAALGVTDDSAKLLLSGITELDAHFQFPASSVKPLA